ncbi:MAG: Ig-like domain-containing protein [Acidobacteria bacterium]|nr:Ig-like domain-containing protein [Acidobacteriota bacterium]
MSSRRNRRRLQPRPSRRSAAGLALVLTAWLLPLSAPRTAGEAGRILTAPFTTMQEEIPASIAPNSGQQGQTLDLVRLSLGPHPSPGYMSFWMAVALLFPPQEILAMTTIEFRPLGIRMQPLGVEATADMRIIYSGFLEIDNDAVPGPRDMALDFAATYTFSRPGIFTVLRGLVPTRVYPADRARGVPIGTSLELEFSDPLVHETASSNFSLRAGTTPAGASVPGTTAVAGARILFFPREPLRFVHTYWILVRGGMDGIRGRDGPETLTLAEDLVLRFSTETEMQSRVDPADGGPAVRAGKGGTVTDDQGTGASITVPPHALKSDSPVRIIAFDSPLRFSEPASGCDIRFSRADLSRLSNIPGYTRVTEITRYEIPQCVAAIFGPGSTIRLPLLAAFQDRLPPGTSLVLFQLTKTADGFRLLNTGIPALVTPSGEPQIGHLAVSPGIQEFGTFAAFMIDATPARRLSESQVP